MLYFTSEVFRRLANQNRGHIRVMLKRTFAHKCKALKIAETLSSCISREIKVKLVSMCKITDKIDTNPDKKFRVCEKIFAGNRID